MHFIARLLRKTGRVADNRPASEDKPVYWIAEICDADWRNRTAPEIQKWFDRQTLERAIRHYELRNEVKLLEHHRA